MKKNACVGVGLIAWLRGVAIGGVLALASHATAQPILLTFEDFPSMSNAPGAAIPAASRLSDFISPRTACGSSPAPRLWRW
ncbi:MAG: hypothetical protein K2Y21_01630 [Phycisphaerales bacterium]|nr:hypothetical protein [Phycisphaerales bacterium]